MAIVFIGYLWLWRIVKEKIGGVVKWDIKKWFRSKININNEKEVLYGIEIAT